MKKAIGIVATVLLAASLIGCVTHGRVYEDSKVAQIKKDVTTEAELVNWFGPPTARSMGGNGSKSLSWKFAPGHAGGHGSSGSLSVNLDADGKVTTYNASAGH